MLTSVPHKAEMSDLFTVICEYDGGTYIVQLRAASPHLAVLSWLDAGVPEALSKEKALNILKDDAPVAVEGCQNVWCCTDTASKGLVLINVVRTAS